MKIARFIAAVALLLFAATASLAHAKLESSEPAAGTVTATAPEHVKLFFSVRVQPAMSSIKVIETASRQAVSVGPVESADADKTILVSLPALAIGNYRVEWRALSADDHMIEGSYEFQIGNADGGALPAEAADSHQGMDHSAHAAETGINWPQSMIRWLIYLCMMLVTGGLVFRLWIDDMLFATDPVRSRSITLLGSAAAILLVGQFAALAVQTTAVMGELSAANAIAILRETSFGLPWVLQAGAAFVSLLLISAARITTFVNERKVLVAAAAVSLLTLLGMSTSGHARAASSDYSFAIFSDWLHLVSAAVWVGGVFMLAVLLPSVLRSSGNDEAGERLPVLIAHFTRIAVPATILLALTGVYNSWLHVDSFAALVETTYGSVLLAKVAIAAVLMILGGVNGFVLQRKLGRGATANSGSAPSSLLRNVRIESLLAIAALLLAALLAFLPPAREHSPVGADSTKNFVGEPR